MKPKEELLPCLMCGEPAHLFGIHGLETAESDYFQVGCSTDGCLFKGGVGPRVKGAAELTRMWNAAAARKQQINEAAAKIKAARESCERQELKTLFSFFFLWCLERGIWIFRDPIGQPPSRLEAEEVQALYEQFVDELYEKAGIGQCQY